MNITKNTEINIFNVQESLFVLSDSDYAEFQRKLIPTVPADTVIGVRVPTLRAFAKELHKQSVKSAKAKETCNAFMADLPHKYYDENLLHGLLIEQISDYNLCLDEINVFLPYVDNWAVCDIMSPKVFSKHRTEFIDEVRNWIGSSRIYTSRFGVGMLMSHYLDKDFKTEYLNIPAEIKTEEYYLKMMIAWYYATALAKQWDATIPYIENHILDKWTHNKTIQKAVESRRISDEQKEYLRTLKLR